MALCKKAFVESLSFDRNRASDDVLTERSVRIYTAHASTGMRNYLG
jgi:hypothetical protein